MIKTVVRCPTKEIFLNHVSEIESAIGSGIQGYTYGNYGKNTCMGIYYSGYYKGYTISFSPEYWYVNNGYKIINDISELIKEYNKEKLKEL